MTADVGSHSGLRAVGPGTMTGSGMGGMKSPPANLMALRVYIAVICMLTDQLEKGTPPNATADFKNDFRAVT